MAEHVSFTAWLKTHADEDSLLGSLARYAKSDPQWPADGDLQADRRYLQTMGASPEFESALVQAWEKYQSLQL